MITGRAATPVHDKLFEIRDETQASKLSEEQALAFHHLLAQLLFMATRARRDIQTVVSFLTMTRNLKLRLTVESLGMLKWYVDGLHNVHWDMRGHGGAVFMMDGGATSSYSMKLNKANTSSSTETELLMADMFMPEMSWSPGILYQDNISTQLLIKNGKMSSGKKTKHIKAKFFFIKDRMDNGEIKVIDCPTEEMWADVTTKPLQ
jgi:hypothetical protein